MTYAGSGTSADVVTTISRVGASVAGGATVATGGGGAVAAGATKAVAFLLNAAGATATVPYAGWIVAGAMVVAAGAMSLVQVGKRRTLRTQEVVALGKQLGFPQAAAFPDFVIDALASGRSWRKVQANVLEKKIAKGRGKSWINTSKLQLLGVIEAMDRADQRASMGLRAIPPSPSEIQRLQNTSNNVQRAIKIQYKNRQVLLLGGATALIVLVLAFRKS